MALSAVPYSSFPSLVKSKDSFGAKSKSVAAKEFQWAKAICLSIPFDEITVLAVAEGFFKSS